MSTTIRKATPDDAGQVVDLLLSAGLPLGGVDEHFGTFVVAEQGEEIVGAAGLEVHEDGGLLRSLVVAPTARHLGLGVALTEQIVRDARAAKLPALYLLTTTAADLFTRLGFERVARDELPPGVRSSRELRGDCPASSVVMRIKL